MSTKRGAGVAKRRELSQRLRRIATGLRIEGAINMAGTLVQAAEVIEASSPSALIAAVEAEMTKKQADMKDIDDMIEEDGPDAERLQFKDLRQGNIDALSFVLNLLRSPPTEEVA